MVKQNHITASQELHLEAVCFERHHQDWAYSKDGKEIGCSHSFVSIWVARHQQARVSMTSKCQVFLRRLLKADADAQQYIDMAAQLLECTIAADVAAKVQQMLQPKFSNQTV